MRSADLGTEEIYGASQSRGMLPGPEAGKGWLGGNEYVKEQNPRAGEGLREGQ